MMNEKIKNWLIGITTAVVAVGIVTAVTLANETQRDRCEELRYTIEDEEVRNYVDAAELTALLRAEGVYPVGMTETDVPAEAIERVVRSHPMVRRAECFLTNDHVCHIRLTQRVPAYRVVTAGESYLVDTDREVMPLRPGMKLKVLTANGHIGKRMAENELFDLMQWLSHDRYWVEQLSRVEVVSPRRVQLVRKDGKLILLGEPADYRAKLEKFRTVDRKAFAELGMPDCKEIDLRYDRQVITR